MPSLIHLSFYRRECATIEEPETPTAELSRRILRFDFNDEEAPHSYSNSRKNVEIETPKVESTFLEPFQRHGSRKISLRRNKDKDVKPYSIGRVYSRNTFQFAQYNSLTTQDYWEQHFENVIMYIYNFFLY